MTFSAANPPPKRKRASDETIAKLTAPSDRKAHYRLSTATWEIILEAYKQGATAKELSEQWRVSEHAIRKRITVHEATKRDWGDAEAIRQAEERLEAQEARARARAEAEAEAAEAASPGARAAVLFGDVTPEEAETLDPADAAALARQGTLASGRAMRKGMWNEAKALASLAESYARLADRRKASELTLDNIPLALVAAIAEGPERAWRPRMSLAGVRDDDPDNEIRRWYWKQRQARMFHWERELSVKYAEGMERGRQVEAQAAGD